MKEDFMSTDSLRDLFLEELRDLYDAEHQILEALPKLAEAASSPELRRAFEEHLSLTREHVDRLEEVFAAQDEEAERKHCPGMSGLIAEGREILKEKMDPAVKDAALISAAQRVEHYEIAAYGSLRTYAKQLDDLETAKLLQQTLEEEAHADRSLSQLAEFAINLEAAARGRS
jgi:ferritin-like metal-binding protein YciE